MWMLNRLAMIGFAVGLLAGRDLRAEDSFVRPQDGPLGNQAENSMLARALGGRRFWGDVHNFRGWRIQQNALTKQHQLVDPKDVRQLIGSYEDCRNELNLIRDKQKLSTTTGPAVIMIHGLLQSSKCMADMGATLRNVGYTTIEFDYPSTQLSIPEAGQYLGRFVNSLEGFDEINFVVHSMGGLVVRAYSAEFSDPRIRRMVMLGTPNHGSELADIVQQYWIFRAVSGPGARQLRTRGDGLISNLPVPQFEFAVIAGSRGTPSGWNPLIPGDDDGTVTVASTRLPGAADFSTVRAIHSRLLWNEEAISQTVNFLKDGKLLPHRESQPIKSDEASQVRLPATDAITECSNRR
jgi:pimeloyl-ACP methyl ester carboxylesterase